VRGLHLLAGAALALTSAWAMAQNAPESLLPPGFDDPPPRPAPQGQPRPAAQGPARPGSATAPRPAANAGAPAASSPVVQPLPATAAGEGEGAAPPAPRRQLTLAELEKLSPEDLEEALGLKPTTDIPPAARRSMAQIGLLAADEGGLSPTALAAQNVSLVRAALAGNKGLLVSRWGHILLRRALASRLDAPAQMNPADFAALRAALLLRMGEGDAARAIVQDVDTGNYTPDLLQAALDAHVATGDLTGICPATTILGESRKDPQWEAATAICLAFRGDGARSLQQLDRALNRGAMPKIDLLLAQKYAGAAGKARRAVTIEWDDVAEMTPWRYGLAIAVGLTPPATLMRDAGVRYDYLSATAPMLGLEARAAAADRAAGAGVLSSAAMVDLYGQIYAEEAITGDWSARASLLRDAYVAADPAARLVAMQQLWNGAAGPAQRYSRMVLTAYAAARMPVDASVVPESGDLIASMLAAGLDQNALRWAPQADVGSPAWAMLVLAAPVRSSPVSASAVRSFRDGDESEDGRRSAFLLAGLAGLGRLSDEAARELAQDMAVGLGRQTRWTRLIDQAAAVDNATLVVLLAGVGMQGDGWDKMTPLHLYHIVAALNAVGLGAEARMIAAEAVARG
jgi:hypothetical protein